MELRLLRRAPAALTRDQLIAAASGRTITG